MSPNKMRDDIIRRVRRVLDSGLTTQTELAKKAGVPQSVISMAVTGYRPVNRLDTLQALWTAVVSLEKRARR